jgi:putative ABC transport system permease protein
MFRGRKSSDFSSEIEAHIRLEADRYRARGMSEEEALATARRAFGNVTSSEEGFYESRRWLWWEHLRQDVRLAVRVLKKTPGWTAVAALTVALGIGATAAIFSIVNVVVLRPLPFPHADQLYSVTELMGRPSSEMALAGDYFTMRENLHPAFGKGIEDMAAYDMAGVTWSGADGAEQLTAGEVTASFFPVLGSKPLYGRVFRPEEDLPEAGLVVVLSEDLWRRKFAGDPAIVGQQIRLNRAPATVIGIMPRSFDFPKGSELWFPFALDEAAQRERKNMAIVGIVARADASASLPQVNAELEQLTGVVVDEYPARMHGNGFIEGMRIFARPLQESLTGNVRPALRVFAGAVGLMLMIVCFNVANLMLTRATVRRREIAVRVALGAPRRRIVSQLITESLMVSLLGGGVGLGLAVLAIRALNSSRQAALAGLPEISIGFSTAAFTLAVTVLTGVVFGLAPSLGSLGFSVREALQGESRSASSGAGLRRMRQALVVAQLGLSLTLLIGAGLLAKSFLQLRNTNPGFRPQNVLTARIRLTGEGYTTIQRQSAFFQNLLDKLKRVPAVQSAAVAPMPIGDSGNFILSVHIEGRPQAPPGQVPPTGFLTVSPDYFKTLGIPLRRGRLLEPRDSGDTQRVVVVNEAFVRLYLPDQDPLGHRISLSPPDEEPVWEEIVGVVGTIHQRALDQEAGPALYLSFLQERDPVLRGASILIHSALIHSANDLASLTPILREAAASIDRDQPIFDVKTLEQRLDDSLGSRRFNAALIGCFALIAAALAAIGVYGVMSYLVALRTSEIGIRMALGEQPGQVLRLIVREGLVLGLIGGFVGVAGALGLSRYLATLLYGVGTRDPATFCAAAVMLFGAVLAACFIPGRRAAHIDPVTALRHE